MRIRSSFRTIVIAALVWLGGAVPAPGLERSKFTSADFSDVAKAALDLAARWESRQSVLLVFDIDNTLLKPETTSLNSSQWFEWQRRICQGEAKPETAPYRVIEKSWDDEIGNILFFLYKKIPQQPTDRKNRAVVRALQDLGFPCMVLTSRGVINREATSRELLRNGFDFSRTSPRVKPGRYPRQVGNKDNTYETGILMTTGADKGDCLFEFIDSLEPDSDPKAVVFIDDGRSNAEKGLDIATRKPLDVVIIRYSLEDQVVEDFDNNKDKVWDIVKGQWERLKKEFPGPKLQPASGDRPSSSASFRAH